MGEGGVGGAPGGVSRAQGAADGGRLRTRRSSAEKLLGGDEPVEAEQRLSENRVRGDELRAVPFGESDVEQVVDRMVVVAASEIPGAVEVAWLVDQAHG